jgi:hypothetical protein
VKIFTCTLSSILLLLLSAQTSAYYFSLDHQSFTNSNLKGFDTVAINIDPPVGLHNMEINRYGVTKTELQNQLTQRIQEAGINVVSFEEALQDPNAALIELKLRVITSYSLYYSIGLNLSVKRKAPLGEGSDAYYSIETWSDGTVGGGSQSDLPKIYTYTSQLVDKLIVAYQDQN